MREYLYKSRNKQGELVKGTIDAESEEAASKLLISKNLIPFDIKDSSKTSFRIPFLNRITGKDKAIVVRQLATMINAGLPIAQSLNTLKEQSPDPKVRLLLEQVSRDIEAGSPLSLALSKFGKVFTPTDVNMIAAGEASGKLDEVLIRMAEQTEKRYKNLHKVRNAFMYPVFLAVVVIVIVGIMTVYVMPQMEDLYKGFGNAQLPWLTRVMLSFSHFVGNYYWVIIILLIAVLAGIKAFMKTKYGEYFWAQVKVNLPVFGKFITMSYVTSFTRTMESLVGSGVPILDSLKITADSMPNILYKEAIMEVSQKVKTGQLLSTSLHKTGLFPVMVEQMIRVGEQTGELDTMLGNLADFYDEELDNVIKNIQTLIEPVMIVVMGIIMGIIIIAVMLPIYQFGQIL